MGLKTVNDSSATRQRRTIYFDGRVQGVGFRYTTRAIAARHAVSGFVENLADGRVLLVAEGDPRVLDAFVADLEAEMARHIETRQVTVSPPTDEFAGFSVRR